MLKFIDLKKVDLSMVWPMNEL